MKIEFTCIECGKKSVAARSPASKSLVPKFCSQQCNGMHRKGIKAGERAPRKTFVCEQCGIECRVYRSPSQLAKQPPRFCSLKCIGQSQTGENNPAYSGGRFIGANGYVYVLTPEHPQCDCRGYVLEHRLVAERELGRFLTDEEVVHHKDRNRANNDPLNLQVFPSQSEHMKWHAYEDAQSRSA